MRSENARAVAKDVMAQVGKGLKVSKRKIIRKHGYAQTIADNPKKVTETKSYKEEIKPFLDRLVRHREKIIAAMDAKNLNKEQYKVLSDALAKTTHDVQLLSGGSTEDVKISWES